MYDLPAGARRITAAALLALSLLLITRGVDAESAPPALAAFEAAVGLPSQATYARIRIPSIDVDAAVAAHVIPEGKPMPNPYGPADVAWYDFRYYPGMGGAPGLGANAVFSAHVDYNAAVPYAGVRYRGPGAFARLGELTAGAVVEVVRNGVTYQYAVSWKQTLPDDSPRWRALWAADVPVDSVTLFTCSGAFDAAAASYSHRIVVRAERLEGAAQVIPLLPNGEWGVGVSGVTHPAVLARWQPYRVSAIWAQDPGTGEWLSYVPGAPAFVNQLLGHLRRDSMVFIKRG